MTVLGEPFGQIEGWCERHYELGGLGCKESKFYEDERDTYLQGGRGDESNSEQLCKGTKVKLTQPPGGSRKVASVAHRSAPLKAYDYQRAYM